MEHIEIKTPLGYTAYLKPTLSFGEFNQIQKVFSSHMNFNPVTQEAKDISGAVMIEANQKALSFLLIKLLDPEGKELSDPIASLDNLPVDDGMVIMEKINEITENASVNKKKLNP